MKTSAIALALLSCAAFASARAGGNDKSAGWPIDDQVLSNVLVSQLDCGAWAKNIDKRRPFDERRRAKIAAEKGDAESATIDNNATTTEIRYLVRHHREKGDAASLAAAQKGVDWLLSTQLANGGWAQFPHRTKGYWTHITFNDNAMRNVLELMRDAAEGADGMEALGAERREKCRRAFEKGLDCVLKCQIRVDGKPTVWCQQHDRETLKPANGRAYELASFCSQESADMVKFLMTLDNPSPEVVASVEGAVRWFERTRLPDGTWARFYDLEECRPFFCDRSGVPKRDISEIDRERSKGYAWFGKKGADVLKKYEKWRAAPGKNAKREKTGRKECSSRTYGCSCRGARSASERSRRKAIRSRPSACASRGSPTGLSSPGSSTATATPR